MIFSKLIMKGVIDMIKKIARALRAKKIKKAQKILKQICTNILAMTWEQCVFEMNVRYCSDDWVLDDCVSKNQTAKNRWNEMTEFIKEYNQNVKSNH